MAEEHPVAGCVLHPRGGAAAPHRPSQDPMCPSRLRRSTQVATESTAVLLTQKMLAMALLLPGGHLGGLGGSADGVGGSVEGA